MIRLKGKVALVTGASSGIGAQPPGPSRLKALRRSAITGTRLAQRAADDCGCRRPVTLAADVTQRVAPWLSCAKRR